MRPLELRPQESSRWDLVSLGEVMLRLDPGDSRIHTSRQFTAWEGGGEYNVAKGIARCFGLRASVATALVENPVGRLIEGLMREGGVDVSHVRWVAHDGVGRAARNGLNFTERGFGVRAGAGCADRGHSAASQLQPGDLNWDGIFTEEGARWFHSGGVFAGLSESTPLVLAEAIAAARRNGTLVSYDLNYRPWLWNARGGQNLAQQINRELVSSVDVLVGNEEDFGTALGFAVEGFDPNSTSLDADEFGRTLQRVSEAFPNLKLVAATLRVARTATTNDWGAICFAEGEMVHASSRQGVEVFDRVGAGDAFVAGLAFGLLSARGLEASMELGAAHGALTMTTPGDTSMATLVEVERVMAGATARMLR